MKKRNPRKIKSTHPELILNIQIKKHQATNDIFMVQINQRKNIQKPKRINSNKIIYKRNGSTLIWS